MTAPNSRDEMVQKLQTLSPPIRFFKTSPSKTPGMITVYTQSDTPDFKSDKTGADPSLTQPEPTDIYLSTTSFPRVLASMTAMEAGAYAMWKCQQQKWTINEFNLRAALVNLEMDM